MASETLTKREELAGMAMQSLIAKSELLDLHGEFGKKVTSQELTDFKFGIASSAVGYADLLIKELEGEK